VDHCSARCLLIFATHLAYGAAGVPIIGHTPDGVPIQVLGVAGMRSEALGQSFPGIPAR
jgi:L-lactate permease